MVASEGIGASRNRGGEGEPAKRCRGAKVGKVSTPLKTRDKVAEFTGVSGRTLDKATAVVEASETDPEKFGHLILGHYGMP